MWSGCQRHILFCALGINVYASGDRHFLLVELQRRSWRTIWLTRRRHQLASDNTWPMMTHVV
jgi:hypothetical protein